MAGHGRPRRRRGHGAAQLKMSGYCWQFPECLIVMCCAKIGILSYQIAAQGLTNAMNELGGRWLVTADHGHAEGMLHCDMKLATAHHMQNVNFRVCMLSYHIATQRLTDATNELGGRWLVTADHGNAEGMVQRDKKGQPVMDDGVPIPLTSHTLSPVCLCFVCCAGHVHLSGCQTWMCRACYT